MTVKVIVDQTDFFVPGTEWSDADSDDELLNQLDEALNVDVSETEKHVNEPQTEPDDEKQFSAVMVLKGSSFHKHFQGAVHSCKKLMLNQTSVVNTRYNSNMLQITNYFKVILMVIYYFFTEVIRNVINYFLKVTSKTFSK